MEDIKFSNVNIYFNLAFDLGEPVNPVDAARQLLKSEFAGGFFNYTTGEQEIAERYEEQNVQYDKYLQTKQIIENMQDDFDLKSYIRLIYTDPLTWGPILFNAIYTAFVEQDEEDASTKADDGQKEIKTEDKTANSSEENTQKDNSNSSKLNEEETFESVEDEVFDSVADFVLTLLGRLAIHANVDRTIFHEDYLAKIPFVRVSLQPFTIFFGDEEISFSVTLTIHRSGVAILTCHATFMPNLEVLEIIHLQRSSLLSFDACEIPSSVISCYYSLIYENFGKDEVELLNEEFAAPDREEWLRFNEMDEESVLAGVFDAYRYAIIESIHGKRYASLDSLHQSLRSLQYFGYPIIFVEFPGTGEELRTQYAEQLAKLVIGFTSTSKLKPDKVDEICDEDFSITDKYSLFLTEGAATVVQYGNKNNSDAQSAEWIFDSYMTTVPIDILILQKAILGIYRSQLEKITLDSTGLDNLYKIKRELLSALDEYQELNFSHYGSVYEIIQRGKVNLRITDSYDFFNQRLISIEGLVQTAEGKNRVSFEQFTKMATTLISALLSLTVAHNIVSIIRGWTLTPSRTYPFIIQEPFLWMVEQAKSRPTFITLILYMLILGVTLIAVWGGRFIRRTKRKQSAIPKTKPVKSSPRTFSPMKLDIQQEYAVPERNTDKEG